MIDNELAADRRLTQPIIYCYGGVPALRLGARDPNGVSANLGFHHVEAASPGVRQALQTAIEAVYNANPNSLESDYMNQDVTRWINAQSSTAIVQESIALL